MVTTTSQCLFCGIGHCHWCNDSTWFIATFTVSIAVVAANCAFSSSRFWFSPERLTSFWQIHAILYSLLFFFVTLLCWEGGVGWWAIGILSCFGMASGLRWWVALPSLFRRITSYSYFCVHSCCRLIRLNVFLHCNLHSIDTFNSLSYLYSNDTHAFLWDVATQWTQPYCYYSPLIINCLYSPILILINCDWSSNLTYRFFHCYHFYYYCSF